MDKSSDYSIMDLMLGNGKSNSIERGFSNVVNYSDRHQDSETLPN